MAETSVIDLRDRKNPPPDDPVKAPYGWRWDTGKREWVIKRSAGGRKPGAAWFGKVRGSDAPAPEEMAPFEEQFDYVDPEPAHLKASAPRVKKTPPKITRAIRDDMTASVGLVGMLVLPPVVARDPFCGGALTDNFQAITDALVPLLCRSATVVGFFTDTAGDFMLWFKLAVALAPVGMAVGQHHVLKTVEIQQDKETGEVFAVKRDMSEYTTTPEPEADTIVTAPAI